MSQSGRFERLEKERQAREAPASPRPTATESRFGSLADTAHAGPPPEVPSDGRSVPTPSARSGCDPTRFEPPPPQKEELQLLDDQEQSFVRCAQCRSDNHATATTCRNCSTDLRSSAQRAFNEAFWRKRAEELAEEEREVTSLRQRRAEADQDAAAAMRQLVEFEHQLTARRISGFPVDEGERMLGPVQAAGRRAGTALGGWAWRTFPNRTSRILFFLALSAAFVGLALALLPSPLVAFVLGCTAFLVLIRWLRDWPRPGN